MEEAAVDPWVVLAVVLRIVLSSTLLPSSANEPVTFTVPPLLMRMPLFMVRVGVSTELMPINNTPPPDAFSVPVLVRVAGARYSVPPAALIVLLLIRVVGVRFNVPAEALSVPLLVRVSP